jgi:hypothetical protein
MDDSVSGHSTLRDIWVISSLGILWMKPLWTLTDSDSCNPKCHFSGTRSWFTWHLQFCKRSLGQSGCYSTVLQQCTQVTTSPLLTRNCCCHNLYSSHSDCVWWNFTGVLMWISLMAKDTKLAHLYRLIWREKSLFCLWSIFCFLAFCFVMVILGFELRTSWLLDECSVTSVIPPDLSF